jgi:hypothetical protein
MAPDALCMYWYVKYGPWIKLMDCLVIRLGVNTILSINHLIII